MRYVSLLNPLACELEDPRGFPMGFISSCTHLRQPLLPLLPLRLHIKPFIPFSRFTSPHRTRPPNFFFWDLVAYNAAVSIDYRLLLLLPPPFIAYAYTYAHTLPTMHAGYPHPASHIMSLDASLLSSNIEAAWEQSQSHHALRANHHQLEPFNFGYSAAFPQYTLSPTLSSASSSTSSASPSSASSSGGLYPGAGVGGAGTGAGAGDYMTMLRKSRMHFNNNPDLVPPEPTCLPTHQLFEFDFPPTPSSPATSSNIPTPPLRSQVPQTLSFSSVSPVAGSVPSSSSSSPVSVASGSTVSKPSSPTTGSAAKRTAATTTASTAKKPRTCVSTKDFVPPDVTGLSKREARLVKNRAAAFLSRQRKREEFELMEMFVPPFPLSLITLERVFWFRNFLFFSLS